MTPAKRFRDVADLARRRTSAAARAKLAFSGKVRA